MNLKDLGLQPHDLAEVMDAHKELADISTTVVAEYGKNFESRINEVKANTIQSDFYFTRLSAESGLYNHDVTLIENNSVSGHKAIGK